MSKNRIHIPVQLLDDYELNENKLHYQAGFLDGEGCIAIVRQRYPAPRRPSFRLRLTIAQNHLRSLADFQVDLGVPGRLYEVKRTKVQNRDHYALIYDGDAAAKVIRRLRLYLRRKRHEADLALRYLHECEVSTRFGGRGAPEEIWRRREWYHAKMRALK